MEHLLRWSRQEKAETCACKIMERETAAFPSAASLVIVLSSTRSESVWVRTVGAGGFKQYVLRFMGKVMMVTSINHQPHPAVALHSIVPPSFCDITDSSIEFHTQTQRKVIRGFIVRRVKAASFFTRERKRKVSNQTVGAEPNISTLPFANDQFTSKS
jgi:hypothetical protein